MLYSFDIARQLALEVVCVRRVRSEYTVARLQLAMAVIAGTAWDYCLWWLTIPLLFGGAGLVIFAVTFFVYAKKFAALQQNRRLYRQTVHERQGLEQFVASMRNASKYLSADERFLLFCQQIPMPNGRSHPIILRVERDKYIALPPEIIWHAIYSHIPTEAFALMGLADPVVYSQGILSCRLEWIEDHLQVDEDIFVVPTDVGAKREKPVNEGLTFASKEQLSELLRQLLSATTFSW